MARQRSSVNYSDVTIMYGMTTLRGSSSGEVCPELSIQGDILQLNEKPLYCAHSWKTTTTLSEKAGDFLERLARILWVRPSPKRRAPVLYIPAPATDLKERQIQDMNYCNFVRTMAEMFKKYAPQLLNWEVNVNE